jgi:hypothetical protein
MCPAPVFTQLALTSVLGWRVRQSGDQGVVTLITELGDRCMLGINADPTALEAIEAAIRLHREELVATAILHVVQSASETTQLKEWSNTAAATQLGSVLSLLSAVVELLEGSVAEQAQDLLQSLCTLTLSRITRLKKTSDLETKKGTESEACANTHGTSSDENNAASSVAAEAERELISMIDLAAPLLRGATHCAAHTVQRSRSVARHILAAVAGNELHRLVLLGGGAQRITHLLETIALVSDDPRRSYLADGAIGLFDEIVYNRLYVTGAIAQQPHDSGHDIVRSFGATHIDGFARTCTTLGWIRALIALRPVLAAAQRPGEIDRILERVIYNALLVSVGTDPTRWFGPIPHGIDRNEEHDLFDLQRTGHRFAPGPWRPNMRSGGVEEQCCAASSLLAFGLVSQLSVYDRTSEPGAVIELAQLAPGETIGEGWELSVLGAWPFDGDIPITVRSDSPVTLLVRLPDWHEPTPDTLVLEPDRSVRFECGIGVTTLSISVPSAPRLMSAHPLFSDIRGCVAMAAGPFIYCLEGADQMGQLQPRQVRFDADGAVTIRREVDHPEAHPTVHATGEWRTRDVWQDLATPGLLGYRWWRSEPMDLPVDITFVPYYTIANRGLWEMAIWIPLATPSDNAYAQS